MVQTSRTVLIEGLPISEGLDEDLITSVVHGFYDEIRRDRLLGPVFLGVIAPQEWPAHLARMCDFWSGALLGTSRYRGKPLPSHLAIPDLHETHFRRWLALFRRTVRARCSPEVADLFMVRAVRIAYSFRLAIAHHRGEDTLGIQPIMEADL